MDKLLSAAEYIRRTMPHPMIWGHNDCACWAATWWFEATGFDPAASLRGTYASWIECRHVIIRSGGLLRLASDLMSGVPSGGAGDGICVAQVGRQVICGVLSRDRLWLKTDHGTASPPDFTILERWSI